MANAPQTRTEEDRVELTASPLSTVKTAVAEVAKPTSISDSPETGRDTTAPAELDVCWRRVISVWWLLGWRYIALWGAGIGSLGLMYAHFNGHKWAAPTSVLMGFLWSVPVSLWITGRALRKRYKSFRIALLPLDR